MTIIISIYYTIAVLFILYTLKKYYITPSLIFVGMQIVMFSGILTYANFENTSDCKLIVLYLIALVCFILGTGFSSKVHMGNVNKIEIASEEKNLLNKNQSIILTGMLIVSILLCTYFFLSAGYNVFLQIIRSMGTSSTNNFTNSRIALNNVSGVGYIYQFRVIILPLVSAFLLSYKENPLMHKMGIVSFPIMIIFVLGTGQRGGFVMFVLMWLVALLYMYKFYKDSQIKKMLIIIVVFAGTLFAIMTIFNGRIRDGGNVVTAMLQRVFDDNQECAIYAFRYIDKQPTQFGRDWFLSIKDILPGKNEYIQLSYVVFDIMYGSTRGTAPPCIWGSVFYNWGYLGVIFFPLLLGFLYHKLYVSFCKKPVTKIRIFIFSAMFVVLGNWIADTPLVLFNQGFVTLYLMKFLLIPDTYVCIGSKRLNG
mgnify:FL=1